jgi:hypothetical protein
MPAAKAFLDVDETDVANEVPSVISDIILKVLLPLVD